MREEYNSIVSTRISAVLADTSISVKPKYQPIYRSISKKYNRKNICCNLIQLSPEHVILIKLRGINFLYFHNY